MMPTEASAKQLIQIRVSLLIATLLVVAVVGLQAEQSARAVGWLSSGHRFHRRAALLAVAPHSLRA
jgi:hypothetical protein